MRLGVLFPHFEIGTADDIRTYFVEVEAMGLEHVSAYDHVLGIDPSERQAGWNGPFDHIPFPVEDDFHEIIVLMTYGAALTKKLVLMPRVLVLPQRQTALAAKQLAELQLLSDGRLRLGVGTGWNRIEYQALGTDYAQRGVIMEEQVGLLRTLWGRDIVDVKTDLHHFDRTAIRPLPDEPIPLWFAGRTMKALRRAARFGDGWMCPLEPTADYPILRSKITEFLKEAGRSDDEFGVAVEFEINAKNLHEGLDIARTWRDLGVDYISINTMENGLRGAHQHLEVLKEFLDLWHQTESA